MPLLHGVLLDGGHMYGNSFTCRFGRSCGEDGKSCCKFTSQDKIDYNEGKRAAIVELVRRVHQLDPSNMVLGNGIDLDFPYLDSLDGYLNEHFMSYGQVDANAVQEPFYRVDSLENNIKIRNQLVEAGKIFLLRTSPGPTTFPVRQFYDITSYSLVPGFPYPQPTTNLEMQQAYKDLLDFPLAVYLCAFQDSNVYFSYNAFYGLRQNVPCRERQDTCQFPMDFDELLETNPGLALTEPMWEGRTCKREFENLTVKVDIANSTSVTWEFPTTTTPGLLPGK